MKHFLLLYDYAPDWEQRRVTHRPAHLALAKAAAERGELELGGAVPSGDPAFGVLLFRSDTATTAEDFARSDPYVTQGVVSSWRVCEWITVVGVGALTKV